MDKYFIEPIGQDANQRVAEYMATLDKENSVLMKHEVYFGNNPTVAHIYEVPERFIKQFENSEHKLYFYKQKGVDGRIQFWKRKNIGKDDKDDEREALVKKASALPAVE